MRQQLKLYFFFALLVLIALPSGAQSRCPSDTVAKGEFLVDLANGGLVGKTSFKLSDKVRIVFINRNPFLRYDVKVESSEVTNPALTTFTGLFDLFSLLKTPGNAPVATAPPAGQPAAADQAKTNPKDDCWNDVAKAEEFLNEAVKNLRQLDQSGTELEFRLSTLKSVFSASQEVLESPTITCEALQRTGERLQKAVQIADLDKHWSAYSAAYNSLFSPDASGSNLAGNIDRALATADASCKDKKSDPNARELLAILKSNRTSLLSDARTQELSKQKTVLGTTIRDISSKNTEIATILAEPTNFTIKRDIGPFDDLTDVKVSVRTRKVADKDFAKDADFSFTLNFGGSSRFTLSLGIAATNLHTPEYEAVQGFPPDANGKPSTTPASVVGLKDNSNQRITPMLMLNTRLTQGSGLFSGLHFSFGISGKVDNKGTDVEYLSGISFGFAENRAFLTLGAYNGRVQKLNQGFSVGSPLGTVPQPPVHKDRSWSPMIAVSFKAR